MLCACVRALQGSPKLFASETQAPAEGRTRLAMCFVKLALRPHFCLEVSSLAFKLEETTVQRKRALATVDLSV